jgi:putative endopeptidase
MKRLHRLAFFALLILAGSCGCKAPVVPPDSIDQTAEDSSVRPQKDFYTYANGGWINRTTIPAAWGSWGGFQILMDQNLANLRSILDSVSKGPGLIKGTIEQQVGDLYISFMDSTRIEVRGLQPLKEHLTRIGAIQNVRGVLDEVALEQTEGITPLFSIRVGADDSNSNFEIAHFDQGGLGLPNRDYYFNQDSSVLKVKQGYQQYITRIFILTGEAQDQASKDALAVMTAETALAQASKRPTDLRDPLANYHKFTVAQLNRLTPGWSWKEYLAKLQINADIVLMGQPQFYQGVYQALQKLPLNDWKAYLSFQLVNQFALDLSKSFVDAGFGYFSLLSGQKEQLARWKRACNTVDQELGEALGQLYVKRYFPAAAKQRIAALVDNLLASFSDHIQRLDWMTDSTKQKALAKLHAIIKKIGYPDQWKDYGSLSIDRGDVISNLINCGKFEYQRQVHKIGKPVDRLEWTMTPPTVNAYYSPYANDVNFPAGILQPPFFFKDGDDAVNYGAIGMAIGHELTHGFDDQGRLYDAAGNLNNWWTQEDSTNFVQKANLVVRQYNDYVAVDTFHINGQLTLGENIADIGGLAIAYSAFKKTAQGKDSIRIDGLTPDQRFFMAFAQMWRTKDRPETDRAQVLTDPHSIPQFRVNGAASDLDAFYKTYHIQPSDGMYRPDSLQPHIW